MRSPDRLLLIGQRDDGPVGVVRFDIQDNDAEVSIYIVPHVKEPGLGRDLLHSAERWFAVNSPGINRVHAHVLGANARSHRLFLGADYQIESACYSKRLHPNG
jgi:RimJ/RimL family protein N-acetyltransferase